MAVARRRTSVCNTELGTSVIGALFRGEKLDWHRIIVMKQLRKCSFVQRWLDYRPTIHCVRPELHRILGQLRNGDVLVVWKLDRLSRSLKDVLTLMEKIDQTVQRPSSNRIPFTEARQGGLTGFYVPLLPKPQTR